MSLNAVKMLGISLTTNPKSEILEFIQKYLKSSHLPLFPPSLLPARPIVIVTPNPEQIILSQQNPYFAGFLNRADVALPDGVGLVLASRVLRYQMPNDKCQIKIQRIPGVEFMEDLVQTAAKEGFPIALIGGRTNLAAEAFECLQAKYPGLKGWAENAPEVEIESTNLQINKSANDKNNLRLMRNILIKQAGKDITEDYFLRLARKIKETNIQMVFVGLGAPKQEYFIEHLAYHLSLITYHRALMSVGGSFDIIAGKVKRAPPLIRLIGFEWLWRLIREPWRWKRQLALAEFVGLVLRDKFLR